MWKALVKYEAHRDGLIAYAYILHKDVEISGIILQPTWLTCTGNINVKDRSMCYN